MTAVDATCKTVILRPLWSQLVWSIFYLFFLFCIVKKDKLATGLSMVLIYIITTAVYVTNLMKQLADINI